MPYVKAHSRYIGVETLEVLQDARRYNDWISSEIAKWIRVPVLEVGAGTGNISQQFIHKKDFYITEKDITLVDHLKRRFKDNPDIKVIHLDICDNVPTGLIGKFGSVFAVNVLEHIADEKKALLHMRTLLRDDGYLVLLVPAKRIAYNALDKKLGHYRRYERKYLISLLHQSGFTIQRHYYFNAVGFFSWIGRAVFEKDGNLRPYQVKLFDNLVPLLRFIESHLRMPFGISLIVIASKNSTDSP